MELRFTVSCDTHGDMDFMSLSRVYRCVQCGRVLAHEDAVRLVVLGSLEDGVPDPIPIVVT